MQAGWKEKKEVFWDIEVEWLMRSLAGNGSWVDAAEVQPAAELQCGKSSMTL